MRTLYFDCFSGISGDMVLGALLDLGLDIEKFKEELGKLKLEGYKIKVERTAKSGIMGTDVEVILQEEEDHHGHSHRHHHAHHHARNLKDIEEIIDASSLKDAVKHFGKKVFGEIARAEAKVHGKEVSEIHFHEVGAIDSIVDIVGASICIDMLGVERILSSALHDGNGTIKCQHGILPVPVPAVMEMLSESDIPLITEEINTELITPTGMGLIKTLALGYGKMPPMRIGKTGYGFGKRETGRLNALRVVLGEMHVEAMEDQEIVVMETNLDDLSGEMIGFTMEKLLENGALDVFYTPIQMKKNRPGCLLTVLCQKEQEADLEHILLSETSTLGIRIHTAKRVCMERQILEVDTSYGKVRVKVAMREGLKKMAPEYEDCRKIAKATGIPLKDIYEAVTEKAKEMGL